jgi:hypothetical protein
MNTESHEPPFSIRMTDDDGYADQYAGMDDEREAMLAEQYSAEPIFDAPPARQEAPVRQAQARPEQARPPAQASNPQAGNQQARQNTGNTGGRYVPEWRKSNGQGNPNANNNTNNNGNQNPARQSNGGANGQPTQSAPVQNTAGQNTVAQNTSTQNNGTQKAPARRVAPYGEAVGIVRDSNIRTWRAYRELSKTRTLPEGLPRFPFETYKNEGWADWGHFLGFDLEGRPFPDAHAAVRPSAPAPVTEARRDDALQNGGQDNRRQDSHPRAQNPDQSRPASARREMLSYEEAVVLLKKEGITTYERWKELKDARQIPAGIPLLPNKEYEGKGWVNWKLFFNPDAAPAAGAPAAGQSPADIARQKQAERDARFEKRKKLSDALKEIKLSLVFDALANEKSIDVYPNQDGDSSKWKIAHLGNFITKGQRWSATFSNDKGYGGVRLVELALEKKWAEAVDWMVEKFGEDLDESMRADLDSDQEEALIFSPPDANETSTGLARKYLITERHLPASLIDREIRRGMDPAGIPGGLYGAHPTDNAGNPMNFRHNIIFRGPASAEVRGIEGSDFKGCLGGSMPEHSGYRVAHAGSGEAIVAMTEAAIDALSYHTFFPGRFVISTNGSGSRFPLQYKVASEMIDRGYGIRAAFDADAPGDVPAQRLCNAFILRKILCHELKVDENQVDEWFLDETITFLPSSSPHENCFNLGWAPEMDVWVQQMGEDENSGERGMVWMQSGERAAPAMRVSIRQDLGPNWSRSREKVIPIGEKAFAYVVNTLNLRRDRPVLTKDWNDDLKKAGGRYIQQYEECAKNDFRTLPELPSEMAFMREETEWVFTTPPPVASYQRKP